MGRIIPPPDILPPPFGPVPDGMDCINCWGIGKPFGDGDTPEQIQITFSGVNKGPTWAPADGEEIDGTFALAQFAVGCAYRNVGGDHFIQVIFQAGRTTVSGHSTTGRSAFAADIFTPCLTDFVNEAAGNFQDGSAIIVIPEVI